MLKELGKETQYDDPGLGDQPERTRHAERQVLADELRQVGVTLNIQMLEPAVWTKRFPKPTYDFELSSNSIIGYLGPDAYLYFASITTASTSRTGTSPTSRRSSWRGARRRRRQAHPDLPGGPENDRRPGAVPVAVHPRQLLGAPAVREGLPSRSAGRWIAAKSVWLDK